MVGHRHASIFGGSSPLTSPSQATSLTPLSPSMPQKPAAMSNIEWIMANAKRQVDEEEEKEEAATLKGGASDLGGVGSTVKRRRTEQYELSDSETDDLPVLDIDSMISKRTAAGKRATASPIVILSPESSSAGLSPVVIHDDIDEQGGRSDIEEMLSPEPHAELPLSLIAGRSKRSTARKEPYSFKLSTKRPSGAKKDIFDPKYSAAVKAKIIDVNELRGKRGQKRSAQVSLSKFLNQINRDNRAGLGPDAIAQALQLIKDTSFALNDDLNDFEDDKDSEDTPYQSSPRSKDTIFSTLITPRIAGEQSGSDSEEEDKETNGTHAHPKRDGSDDSHSRNLQKIKAAMEREIQADGDDENEQTNIAVQVLINDHAKAVGHETAMDDIGIPERLFWSPSQSRVIQPIARPGATAKKGLLARIQRCIESDNDSGSNRDTQLFLASLLSDTRFAEELLQLKSDDASFTSSIWPLSQWLIRKAIVGPNDHVTESAIHATSLIFQQYVDKCATLALDVIRSCLLQLGAKEELLQDSGALAEASSSSVSLVADGETERKFSRTSRVRRTAKAVDICNHLIDSLANAEREAVISSEPLFFWLLALACDPGSEFLRIRIKDLSRSLIDTIFKHSNALESDLRLCNELFTKLKHQSNTTRMAALDALPKHSLRSRVLIRNVAVRLFTCRPPAEKDAEDFTYTVIATDLPALRAVLSKKRADENPLFISRLAEPDYIQMNAAVALFQFCLMDLMLQLSSTDKHRHKPSKAQETTYESLMDAGLDQLIRHDSKWIARAKSTDTDALQTTMSEPIRLSPDWSKARELCKIQEQLDRINARVIADGGGGGVFSSALRASEGQARLKDALQRASFMIRFFLDQFGMSKDRITLDRQQSLEYFATKK